MKKIVSFFLGLIIFIGNAYGELPLGEKPPLVTVPAGRIDGSDWVSTNLAGKVYVLLYIDPDERDLNQHVKTAIKKEKFPEDQFGFIAVMNLGATWIPNAAIESMIKGKQKEMPNTIYVKDRTKELVKKWALKDDSFDVVAFDREGRVIYSKDEKLSQQDIDSLIGIIKKSMG